MARWAALLVAVVLLCCLQLSAGTMNSVDNDVGMNNFHVALSNPSLLKGHEATTWFSANVQKLRSSVRQVMAMIKAKSKLWKKNPNRMARKIASLVKPTRPKKAQPRHSRAKARLAVMALKREAIEDSRPDPIIPKGANHAAIRELTAHRKPRLIRKSILREAELPDVYIRHGANRGAVSTLLKSAEVPEAEKVQLARQDDAPGFVKPPPIARVAKVPAENGAYLERKSRNDVDKLLRGEGDVDTQKETWLLEST